MKKKIIAIILSVSVLLGVFMIPVSANTEVTEPGKQKMYTFIDKLVNTLVGGIASMIVTPDWPSKKDYKTPDTFFPGNSKEEFKSATATDAWYVGYSNNSIVTGNEVGGNGDYYVGGSLKVTKKLATKQLDDQKVRVAAISDGGKINIFAVIDAYGLANTDVRAIRKQFIEQYKGDKEINTINISVLHQHSCVDTFGLNGDIINALFTSSLKNLFRAKTKSGKNEDYMKNLYEKTVDSMNKAVAGMKAGKLYFGKIDAENYIRDKRDPQVFDHNLNRLRFVPNDGSKEIWIVEAAIHCVGRGAGGTELTGDYPLYMERYINNNDNADFLYLEGAELAISGNDRSTVYDDDGNCTYVGDVQTYADEHKVYDTDDNGNKIWNGKWIDESWNSDISDIRAYGESLAIKLEEINEEREIEPIINVAFKETYIKIDNNILVLAAKGGLLVNNVLKSGFGKFEIVTEIGYAELGTDLSIALIPGELAPEIAFGGAEGADKSWYNEDWDYPSFTEMVNGRELLVFGLMNDQIGYILPSNNWHSYFTENEEIVSTGRYAGRVITESFEELVEDIKG